MTGHALSVAVLAGIALHAGIFHLLMYFRSTNRPRADLYFGATALLIAVYNVCCIGLYNSRDFASGVFWQRMQLAVVASAGLSFIAFVQAYAGLREPRWIRRVAWSFLLLGAFAPFDRRGWLITNQPFIKYLDVPLFGRMTYFEGHVGPLYYLVACTVFYIGGVMAWAAWCLRRCGETKSSRTLLSSMLLFLVGGFNDALISLGCLESIYLFEYTWTGMVVLAGSALSSELMEAALSKQQLAENRARLAHAERLDSVGKLAGGVAHDLNNMLTPVLGYAELARNLMAPSSRERRYIDHLMGAAERAAALTRHLLAFARKQVLEVRALDLADSLKQLAPLLRRLLPENVALAIEADTNLPLVEADRTQLEQVWMNLACNARDAMPDGGSLRFEVHASDPALDGRGVVVTVKDNGAGMTAAVRERAFEPFFSTKARGQGTGLGLSIVHGIVEQHGGRIALTSQPGQGTTFRLFMPATDKQPVGGERQSSEPRLWRRHAQVLVVDDDLAVLSLTRDVLREYGYVVHSASSRAELSDFLSKPPAGLDVLLSDVILPDMDGNLVLSLVRQRFPEVSHVFMTGHADEVLAPRGVLRDPVELLRKPFTSGELLSRMVAALDASADCVSSSRPLPAREASGRDRYLRGI